MGGRRRPRPGVEAIIYRFRAESRGVICRGTSAVADGVEAPPQVVRATGPGIGSWPRSWPMPTRPYWWTGRSTPIPRWCAPTSTARTRPARPGCPLTPAGRTGGTQGARSNDNNPGSVRLAFEPTDHAVGRSRGGLSTKVHLLVDDAGRPLVVLVSPGHAGDNPALQPMLNATADHPPLPWPSALPPRPGPRRQGLFRARHPRLPIAAAASRPSSQSRTTKQATANAAAPVAASR